MLNRLSVFVVAVLVSAMFASRSSAEVRTTQNSSIAALVSSACAAPEFSGSVLVRNAAGRLYFRSCGLADRSTHRSIDQHTRFKLFSVSKSITALTVLKLEQNRQLRVDTPISAYLPAVPPSWRRVTVEQLLQHTSGLPDLTGELYDRLMADAGANWSTAVDDVLAHHKTDPAPPNAPGLAWNYNNFGYEILARIVEHVSRRPFAEVVRRNVLDPAGMRSAYFAQRIDGREGPRDARLARGYACGTAHDAEAISHSFIQQGAGAVIASPDDLLALTRYLRRGRLIPLSRLRQLMAGAFKDTGGAPYGEGFLVRSASGVPYFQHSGGNNGYIAEWAWTLDSPATVIILTNSSCAQASDLRANLMQLLVLRPVGAAGASIANSKRAWQ